MDCTSERINEIASQIKALRPQFPCTANTFIQIRKLENALNQKR